MRVGGCRAVAVSNFVRLGGSATRGHPTIRVGNGEVSLIGNGWQRFAFHRTLRRKLLLGRLPRLEGSSRRRMKKYDGIYSSQGVDLRFDAAQVIRAEFPAVFGYGARLLGPETIELKPA